MNKTVNGEVVFDGEYLRTEYGALVDEHGKEIPPTEVNVEPVLGGSG